MSGEQLRPELSLSDESDLRRKLKIQDASGKTSLGLHEGFIWLVDAIKARTI